jgi:hypothetical protein
MHCDGVRARLLDQLDDPAAGTTPGADLDAHLESCDECRSLRDDILTMQSRARVWHELEPPPWNADPWPRGSARAGTTRPHWLAPGWLGLVQQWFPVVASSAALLLAVSIYWGNEPRGNEPRARDPAPVTSAANPAGAPPVEQLLAASRQERQQEMEALTALLKAEMDRRSLETEQSLKYIISHQIQSQRELESMRGRLRQAEMTPSEQL